jgi:class 3 adenylate cyclase
MRPHAQPGPRTRRLVSYLRRRRKIAPARRPATDEALRRELCRPRGIVFTDTADFTLRTARDGILHFLMIFERLCEAAAPALKPSGGRIVKVEADSLLLDFPGVIEACEGTLALDRLLQRLNAPLPRNEKLRFSYGIGYGEVLDLEGDIFGLEVNVASKLGEDLALPGEALLTPAATLALAEEPIWGRRLVPYRKVRFGGRAYAIERLPLPR